MSAGSAVRLAAYLGRGWEPRGYGAANAYCGRALTVPVRTAPTPWVTDFSVTGFTAAPGPWAPLAGRSGPPPGSGSADGSFIEGVCPLAGPGRVR